MQLLRLAARLRLAAFASALALAAVAGAIVATALAVTACKPSDPAADPPARPVVDLSLLHSLPAKDLVGYLTGAYGTISNNPAIYADTDRKLFVLMGKRGTIELPLDKPDDATAAYEQFLVAHGFPANGAQPTDDHAHVVVNGQSMVLVSMDELFPKMPPELEAHFTQPQLDLLYRSQPIDCYVQLMARYPTMTVYSQTLVVFDHGTQKDFPLAKANEAFASFRKLVAAASAPAASVTAPASHP